MRWCYLFHHSDFCGHIDESSQSNIRRVDMHTLSIDIDIPIDDRSTWLFKGLSASTVNNLLHVISSHQTDISFKSLSDNAIRQLTVPYDDMLFRVGDEELQVVYSIRDIETSPFRRCIIGPHDVQLYEKNFPLFGPFFVYKSNRREEESAFALLIVHELQDIVSSPTEILKAMSLISVKCHMAAYAASCELPDFETARSRQRHGGFLELFGIIAAVVSLNITCFICCCSLSSTTRNTETYYVHGQFSSGRTSKPSSAPTLTWRRRWTAVATPSDNCTNILLPGGRIPFDPSSLAGRRRRLKVKIVVCRNCCSPPWTPQSASCYSMSCYSTHVQDSTCVRITVNTLHM